MGQALATGDVLRGKYRLEQVLGRGGMGIVHLATHLVLGQRVAIKLLLLRSEETPEDEKYVTARFIREARAAALLESEHVVRILDVDAADDGTPFMVMEYLQGEDLAALLRTRGRVPVEEAVAYVLGACEALAEAHARGIVHRDLKPSNLFRAETAARKEPVIKLLDFGISKLNTPGEDLSLTDTNAVIGSPIYMSPEQLLSSRDVNHRTDIWSLGVTLYKLASGALPFEASSASALGAQIAAKSPRPLSEVLSGAAPTLEQVVMRCMARSAADRYADVVELARALEPLARDPDLVAAVERARERGNRAGIVRPSAEAQAAPSVRGSALEPPVLEASGERWTRSQQGVSLEASGDRWTRSQLAEAPVPAAPLPEATKDATPQTPSAPPPSASLERTGTRGGVQVAPPPAAPKRGILIALIAVVAVAIAFGITYVAMTRSAIPEGVRNPPLAAAPSPPVVSTAPVASTATSEAPPPATTDRPPATVSARPSVPVTSGAARPRAKPKGTWSKDPSELDIK